VERKQILSRVLFWQNWLGRSTRSANTQATPWPHWLILKGQVFLFGIDWEYSPFEGSKNKELQAQRKNGFAFYAVSRFQDAIGYVKALPAVKGKKYAAALHICDQQSQGGIEIFCFHLNANRYALIALNESKPVPGHDYIGSKENVWQLGMDFANLQENQPIRYVGNAGIFDMEETLTLEKVFSNPSPNSEFASITNQPLIVGLASVILTVFGLIYGVNEYFAHIKQQQELQRQAMMNDPNLMYERSIEPALKQVTNGGRTQIDNWMQTIGKLPLKTAGWRLNAVSCNLQSCTATWNRQYGNFSELFNSIPVAFASRTELMDATKPGNSTATTTHLLLDEPKAQGLSRSNLPVAKELLSQFSSQLQDLSLLDNTVITLDKPALFPITAQGTPDSLNRAVVRGNWGLQLELWTIGSLNLFPNVVPETLDIQFSEGKQDPAVYSLKGSFYALNK
jgi:hypothetical protein